MLDKAIPYIGITGFKEVHESISFGMLPVVEEIRGSGWGVMFGVVCTDNRLANPAVGGSHSPSLDGLPGVLEAMPNSVMPAIHYFTHNRDDVGMEVKEVLRFRDMYERGICRTIQINMEWPDPGVLEMIKGNFPDLNIILQMPKSTLENPYNAGYYDGLVDYCIIDPSGGKGKGIKDSEIGLLSRLRCCLPDARAGVAGGLSGDDVGEMMRKAYHEVREPVCVDAEDRLRKRGSLDMGESLRYLRGGLEGIRACVSRDLNPDRRLGRP